MARTSIGGTSSSATRWRSSQSPSYNPPKSEGSSSRSGRLPPPARSSMRTMTPPVSTTRTRPVSRLGAGDRVRVQENVQLCCGGGVVAAAGEGGGRVVAAVIQPLAQADRVGVHARVDDESVGIDFRGKAPAVGAEALRHGGVPLAQGDRDGDARGDAAQGNGDQGRECAPSQHRCARWRLGGCPGVVGEGRGGVPAPTIQRSRSTRSA